jgi:TrmH family RNA methyltransferase
MIITSLQNEQVKHVRALQAKSRARRKTELFVVEGVNLIEEALLMDAAINEIFYTEDFVAEGDGMELIQRLSEMGAPMIPVSEEVMQEMSDTQTPQGILAVLPWVQKASPDLLDFVMVIDGVGDPGNMGTIMRSAVGAGVQEMVLTAGTVDVWNPKVVRAGMGAHFRIPIRQLSWEGIRSNFEEHVIFLADASSAINYYDIDWTQPSVLIVSDETQGASEDALRTAHVHTGIPMAGNFDSLNVAAATAVMLFEAVRQRAKRGSA